MKKLLSAPIFLQFLTISSFSQKTDIGVHFGRLNAIYKFYDYGTGFRNVPGRQYNSFLSISLTQYYSKKISAELRGSYLPYKQNTATRLYPNQGFAWDYSAANVSLTGNYTFINSEKFESRVKLGIATGIFPDRYEGASILTSVNPPGDSISRGTVKRDYSLFLPAFSTGLDFSYKIAKRYKISLAATYQKGFSKITEYDIYYNDGSGSNDQRARQWGTGDFYGIQLGLRYAIRDEVW